MTRPAGGRRTGLIALLLCAALVLSGCAGARAVGKQDQLVLAVGSEPLGLDPADAANGNTSIWFVELAYQTLLTVDDDGQVAPGLASSYRWVGSDSTHLRLTLRKGLKFSDGSDLTAQSVVASLQYFVKGSGPSNTYFKPLTFTAKSEDTVDIVSKTPNPLLPTLLTSKYMGGGIISPAGLAQPKTLNAETYGAGPYKLDPTRTISGDSYVYVPNPNYYDQSAIKYQRITIRIIANPTSQIQALKTGQVDVIQGDVSTVDQIDGMPEIGKVTKQAFWNGLYFLDREGKVDPALADVRVRRALNYAIDRKSIAQAAYGEYGHPESQPMSPGDPSFGYDKDLTDHYSYDPAKARKLLAEAGYAKGFTVSVPYKSSQASSGKMVQAIAAQLKQVGVTVKLLPGPSTGDWLSKLVSLKNGAVQQDSSGRPLLLAAGMGWLSGGVLNPFNVDDPDIDAAYKKLQEAGTDEDGTAAKAMMRVLTENAYTLPVATVDEIILYNKNKVSDVRYLGETPKLAPIYMWDAVSAS